ncbi:hypothetical protein MCOR25_004053 [Pyricularia grisea]|uniref:Peroxin 20 n=1 Tax=Pyricularia grisea TaxID=148305 RepID=A0A6P8AWX8_PYRGI|nr:uncharacterized protein PgNI_08679 [Pyricularia grisea]KAI6371119.1 hypothetical protein MCOR25_004053 [Pyricularia grisea]TLD06728.1 hypothetical protein PgNI_08679 [Pyricularia grisea]
MSGQDSMCGGANPLKSFQDQVGRDRSLHQDRAVNNGTASTSFRSGFGQTTTNGDQEFANFQAGMANLPSLPAMPAHLNGPIPGHPSSFAALGPRQQLAPAPANVAAVSPNWAEEFRQLQANNMVHAAPAPAPAHGLMSARPAPHGIMSVPAPAMGFNTAAQFNPMFQQHIAMGPAQAQTTAPATAQEAEHPLVKDAFDAQFAQVEANQEAVDHLQRHAGSFEDEMDQWMQEQEHGPPMTAEEQEAAIEQFHDERMTMIADQEDMTRNNNDDDVNALADDMAKTHVDDLRRTAGEIVDRLGDAPQYQQSTFLTLMRNIMDGNVTVDDAQEGFVTTNDHQPYTGHLEDPASEDKQEKN